MVRRLIKAECRLATRFAILSAEEVLVPASSFFESELCFDILDEFRDIYQFGNVWLVGGGENILEFIEDKLIQYRKSSVQYKRYMSFKNRLPAHPPFLSRRQSSTRDIAHGWLQVVETGNIGRLVEGSNLVLPSGIESRWANVPNRLDGKAFIVSYVEPLLFDSPGPGTIHNRLHGIINEHYFGSYTREFCAGVVTDLNYLTATHSVPSYDKNLPYRHLVSAARNCGLLSRIEAASAMEILRLKVGLEWQACLAVAYADYSRALGSIFAHMNLEAMGKLAKANVGIITALPEEFAAVCEVLACDEPIDFPGSGAGRKYAVGRVTTHTGAQHFLAVALLTDMGNDSAAIRATQMMMHCRNIDHIIMTGIAGAVPCPEKAEEHVRLGDVVVSNRNGVIQYDLDKESPTEMKHRHPPRPPGATLLEAVQWLTAQEMRGRRGWEPFVDHAMKRLGDEWQRPSDDFDRLHDWVDDISPTPHPTDPQRRPGKPRVFHGPIASANKLLKNPVKRDYLRDTFGVKAVEMEGAGIADATWSQEKGYLVVRGTCDYCNSDKGDIWHKYAALAAAAYTRAVIEVLAPSEKGAYGR